MAACCQTLLHHLTVANSSYHPAATICTEHLRLLGANTRSYVGSGSSPGELSVRGAGQEEVDCFFRWQPSDSPSSEATIQAISGLIGMHSLDRPAPVRLGLDVASVAAGILATQAVLAALIARFRGQTVPCVSTSVLDGAMIFLRHHLAIATSNGSFPFRMPKSGTRPPFQTSDGHWFEIEALSGDDWKAFWSRLGLDPIKTAGEAWLPYVYRYLSGRCRLPISMHQVARLQSLSDVSQVARELGVGMCRVRTYEDLLTDQDSPLADLLGSPWTVTTVGAPATHRPLNAVSHAAGPLAGIRVVEATSRLQGPLAGLLLGMLGAEVIKVEPPGGDFGKHSPPLAASGSVGAAYLAYNLGKTCLEIDYKSSKGLLHLRELVAGTDVFIHNWRPGRAEQLGLDAESLLRINPGLIYAEASGWGRYPQPCPIAGDFLVQAHAACGDGLRSPGEPPFPSPLTLVDVAGGLLAAEAVLAGVYSRERSGSGCKVETSLLASAMSLQSSALRARMAENGSGHWHRPSEFQQPLQTGDGFLVVDDSENRIASLINGPVVQQLRHRSASEWEEFLTEAGIAAGEVRTKLHSLASDSRFAQVVQRADEGCVLPVPPWRFASRISNWKEVSTASSKGE